MLNCNKFTSNNALQSILVNDFYAEPTEERVVKNLHDFLFKNPKTFAKMAKFAKVSVLYRNHE